METTHPPENLGAFLRIAKGANVPDDSLVGILTAVGWSRRRVYRALGAYYTDTLGGSLPREGASADDARDAFFYLLNFITLGFWTVALGNIFYVLIDRAFPDAAAPYSGLPLIDALAWPIATVLVAFPTFAFIAQRIAVALKKRPDAAVSGVRAWLTYVALVLAALVVLLDGIWFLDTFLSGQLTLHFVLDSLVLLVLGGGVFVTYLSSLQRGGAAT
ncbi:MAG: DUF5671 domain-containing protein [Vulcanimicrobiaceae bacterium]|jgi:hypothetical protein